MKWRSIARSGIGMWLLFGVAALGTQAAEDGSDPDEIRIVELQGTVEVSPAGAKTWVLTQTNQILYPQDRVRTDVKSRVGIRWSRQCVIAFGASTELEIEPPHASDALPGLRLVRGVMSFLHREQPGRIRVLTRGAVAGVEGTEFVLTVSSPEGVERSTLSVIDGKVRFGSGQADLLLTSGEQAVVEAGQAPRRTVGFVANNLLQWCFYYPAVLDLEDLALAAEAQAALSPSLAAYRTGDVLAALAVYPAGRQPASANERLYYAALLLSVGEVEQAEATLATLAEAEPAGRIQRLAGSLRRLIAAVRREEYLPAQEPQLASEFLASAYYEQSRAVPEESLKRALTLSRQAVALSPKFGFAWERVAELEFSFGRNEAALEALEESLKLSGRNAQTLALKGFVLAAQGRSREAITWFDQALAVDSALGNAWLGRGLCRIRLGDAAGGCEDLLVAAALEPRRAELRSYLGKATGAAGDFPQAVKELQLAKKLDPNDPTAWLYSALLNQQHNRINEAIRDLERSQELNDNRSVYRSRLLLDQDQAVRSASLAAIYQDAGLADVAVREAARAVNYDYGNYSAHLFLADSLNPGTDLANRRYETATEVEVLLANLLAPVGAGTLSPSLSEARNAWLFESNRLGLVSSTSYLGRGAWNEWGTQYGVSERFSYGLKWQYNWDPGQLENGDLEFLQLGAQVKAQLTPADTLYASVRGYKTRYGDLQESFGTAFVNRGVRNEQTQEPEAMIGYHHEWNPGVHTLVLASYLRNTLWFTNTAQPILHLARHDADLSAISNPDPALLAGIVGLTMRQDFETSMELGTAEAQQIWQQSAHNTVLGGRFQYGTLRSASLQNWPSTIGVEFPDPPEPSSLQDLEGPFRRVSLYGYHQWEILETLQLSGGVAYDWMAYPENYSSPPISSREETADKVTPKAGIIWTPAPITVMRFAYTRSLGGVQMDQSVRLEPSQVAGFVQAFRGIIPDVVAGPSSGAEFETFGLSVEQKLRRGAYLSLAGEFLNSEARRTVGSYDAFPFMDNPDNPWGLARPGRLRQHLDYQEPSVTFAANQLLGDAWAVGVRYRLSRAELDSDYVDVRDGINLTDFQPRAHRESLLHEVELNGVFNHRCGFTARAEALWFLQDTAGYMPGTSGDEFWQFNLYAGYRFPRRRAEVLAGWLNITDQDYELSPLNLHRILPRERTFVAQLRVNF